VQNASPGPRARVGQGHDISRFAMRAHLGEPFPKSIEKVCDYGEVDPVLVGRYHHYGIPKLLQELPTPHEIRAVES
jgi:hypothetical protein